MFQLRFRLNRCSSGAAWVEGSSTGVSTAGVYGTASLADGVHGVTSGARSSAVSGISVGTTGTAHGVYGRSSNGQGVYGTSSNGNGIEGHSTAYVRRQERSPADRPCNAEI